MDIILSGKVFWSYDYELLEREVSSDMIFSFMSLPFYRHTGKIELTNDALIITGADELKILFEEITQVYMGFDEIFSSTLVKNFGLFWQPLRITLQNRQNFYLVIDYGIFGAKNKLWFNALQQLLSD